MPHSNEKKFEQAFKEFGPIMILHIYFRVSNWDAAEELMQETFFRAWQRAVRNKEEIADMKKFLYRVANNLVIDHYRQKAHLPAYLEDIGESAAAYDPHFGEDSDRAAELRLLNRIMPQLKESYRRVMYFYYIHDLSVAEISRLTGLSQNNIRVIRHRGVQKLKQLIGRKTVNGQGLGFKVGAFKALSKTAGT